MAMNEIELAAVDRKLDYPNEDIKCPRCGELLGYYEFGNSSKAYCKNCEDVEEVARGI